LYDPIAANITAIFLVLVVVSLVRYLWDKLECTLADPKIHPTSFLIASASALLLTLTFLPLLGPTFVLLAFATGAGITLTLIHPVIATSFFLANLILRPWELLPPTPFTLIVPKLLASLCLFSWILNKLKAKRYEVVWNPTCTLFALFLGWLALASLFSPDPLASLQFEFDNFFPTVVVVLLIVNTFRDPLDLRLALATCTLAVTGTITTALYLTISSGAPRLDTPNTLYGNANDLASLIVLVLPLAFFAIVRRRSLISRIPLAFQVILLLCGLWSSQSRGAMLALAISGVAYFVCFVRKSLKTMVVVATVLVLAGAFFSSIDRSEGDLEGSRESRWNYVIAGYRMVRAYPLFGVGLDNYPKRYEEFTPSFTEWGHRTAHSTWVLVMSETGIMGLLLFVALFGASVGNALAVRAIYPELILALTAYGVAMSFLSHAYLAPPYLLFALILAARRVARAHVSPANT
jgi:putative inorganic carbon (hco3(-)) transporter